MKNKKTSITDFIFDKSKYRYYLAVLVLLGIVLTLFRCTNSTAQDENPLSGAYATYKQDKKTENSDLTKLLKNYYKAYAAGDAAAVKKIADPVSDREASYIKFFGKYVDSYDDIKVYFKRGLDDKSYLVSVSMKIKFKDIDTAASGLDFFYVSTDKNGKLYINNLYSNFNTNNNENEMNEKVVQLIAAFEQQDDVQSLQADIQQKFNEAMLKDEKLNTFLSTTLPAETDKWNSEYTAEVAKAEQEKAAAKKQKADADAAAKKQKADADAAAKKKAEDEKNKVTKYTTQAVTVYQGADSTGAQLGTLEIGSEVTKYADEGNFSRISYNNGDGYVETQYLSDTKPAATDSVDVAGVTPGAALMLHNTVRVRQGMDENSSVVDVVYAGMQVTVGQNFASGWTSVTTSSGKSGYVRSDLLQ
jgi:hypothetical protein